MNEGDNQVRAAHKILRYNPIHKSFSAHKITIVEHGFLLPERSSAQEGAMLAGSSSSQQAAEAKEVGAEGEEQVAELG